MKKQARKALLFISLGSAVIGLTQILNHYQSLPDEVWGALSGIGISLLISALIKIKKIKTIN